MIVATVKSIIDCWEKGGLFAVKAFLSNDIKIYENTWAEKIKKLIDEGHIKSVEQEIELVSFNINLERKLFKNKLDGS
jgi:ABC-type oligopeptide transport system substrate-binding subunit